MIKVERGLQIRIANADDYLKIEIHASNARFGGTTRVFTGLDGLGDFAAEIEGFPAHSEDERNWKFGRRDPSIAGGYCRLRFRCLDRAGHPTVEICIVDDEFYAPGSADFSVRVEASGIDRFVARLRELHRQRVGEATLPVFH